MIWRLHLRTVLEQRGVPFGGYFEGWFGGQIWEWVKGILRTEFNGGKRQISKLTYKCMEHEYMKINWHKKNDIDSLETINIILELKNKFVPLNLALSKFCNNLNFFFFIYFSFFIFLFTMFDVMKCSAEVTWNLPQLTLEPKIDLIWIFLF
jgi:hypothetical protein